MKNYTPNQNNFQHKTRRELLVRVRRTRRSLRKAFKLTDVPSLKMTAFVCDECAAPLHLYGENFIDSYTDGQANILRCLCDLCAEEFGLSEVPE